MQPAPLAFNGINARTGDYLLDLSAAELTAIALGDAIDPPTLAELRFRIRAANTSHYGTVEGVDVHDLAQTGWGVVFPSARPDTAEDARQQAILEALKPLLDHRRAQATRRKGYYFKSYTGPQGYRANEGKQGFLARHGAGPGPADPEQVPYYLLLVGDPTEIPYRFQSQLGVQRAVGRLYFETLDEFANYARSVVAAETGDPGLARRATFFGVANPGDGATLASSEHLVGPIADALQGAERFADWSIDRLMGEQATRGALEGLLHGGDAPALLFAASHGMGFPKGDPNQLRHQGALLCQDWPGPAQWRNKAIPEDFYLAGDHLSKDADLSGTMAFLFACYGAGTPELDEFARIAFKDREPIAPMAFVAGLPTAMLNRPKGGALAVIGHVERAWGSSFMWEGSGEKGRAGAQTAVFDSTLRALMGGMPVGAAMGYFPERYAELSSDLSIQLEERDAGLEIDEYALAGMWTANNDARGYAILGDPAVRLSLGNGEAGQRQEEISFSEPVVTAPRSEEAAPPETGGRALLLRLTRSLEAALGDNSTLEVSTWVSPDPGGARFSGEEVEGATLRARTRMALDGSTVACLPEPDRALWEAHTAMVQQAAAARAELLRAVVAAANALAALEEPDSSPR